MISRSNTITNDRLRRSRSAASMQAASSRQRSSAPPDPFVVRQHAEAAASQAYKRAQPIDHTPPYPDYRPVPPMLQRRRSQITGRSEGSHLEDARLGRRRSTARRDENKPAPSTRRQSRPASRPPAPTEIESSERAPATFRPASEVKAAHRRERLISASHGYQRRPPSAIRNGSPPARTGSAVSGNRASSLALTPRRLEKSYDDGISVTYTEPHSYSERTRAEPTPQSRRISIRETQTDDEIIALARERVLEDFQRPKIRERKSFFGSFQKLQRRDTTDRALHSGIQYDNSLPPFNYADDFLVAPLPPAHDVAAPSLIVTTKSERKTSMFSGSVKGHIKKFLRKASRLPGPLPTQNLDESQVQTSILGEIPCDLRSPTGLQDPFVVDEPLVPPKFGFEAGFPTISNASNASLSGDSAADKSRVTSWTNSTAAGTASTRTNTASMSLADEHGRVPKTSSGSSTLRKKSSFFGRAVQNRLRRSSRADLKGSEDSQALFTALQERIQPREQAGEGTPRAFSATSEVSRASSDFSTLPSRVRADSLASSGHCRVNTTIRSVFPDPDLYKMQTMSPVVETSPDRLESGENVADGTPTANHAKQQRRAALVQAAPPSPERIARRVQQSHTRWQGTLHPTASAADRKIISAYDENNPYELPSLGRGSYPEPSKDTGGLPHHAKLSSNPDVGREKLLSPSVYSRATDGASPRPCTPDEGGLMVTVTSREVKRYEISPKKDADAAAQRPIQASNEWRQWFSNEMNGIAGSEDARDLSLNSHREYTAAFKPTSRGRAGSGSQWKRSGTPASDQPSKTGRESRPRASSRRSSYMNDRYPMLDCNDSASRQSNRTSCKYSMASNAGTDSERPLQTSGSEDDKCKPRRNRAFSGSSRLSKSHSIAHIESSLPKASDPPAASDSITMSGAIPNEAQPETKTRHKHKSAFDLRAKYKSSNSSASRPVEVRRKPTAPIAILEDNTIRNISAGPYAAPSSKLPAMSSTSNANKENTPPHNTDDGNLPALSSSEWLAGPPGKKRPEVARANSSPPKAVGFSNGGREGSPGQRLVTGWLEGRKGKGGDEAAFV